MTDEEANAQLIALLARLVDSQELASKALMHMAETMRENIAGAHSSIAEYHERYVSLAEAAVRLYEQQVSKSNG